MQSAYKYAVIQAFAIPVTGSEDADARSPRLAQHAPAPGEGWEQWCEDITELVRLCESREALDRLQQTQRTTLAALQPEQPGLYAELGKVIAARRAQLICSDGSVVSGGIEDGAERAGNETPAEATRTPESAVGEPVTARPRPRRRRAGEDEAVTKCFDAISCCCW